MSKKNEAVKAEENTIVATTASNLPSFIKQGPARGAEHVTQDDITIPRLEVVQSLSACRKKSDPAYIEGAEEGMLYNSVTRALYGQSVEVVPVAYRKEFLLWKDRKKGGGFRGAFPTMADAEKARAAMEDGDDVEINDTAQHFCLLLDGDRAEEIVVSMAKSKLKTSRKWNTLIRIAEVDSFAKSYTLNGVAQQNNNGDEFFGMDVTVDGWVNENTYHRAEGLWKMIESGKVKVSTEGMDDGATGGSTEY